MDRMVGGCGVLALALSVAVRGDGHDMPPTPAEQYKVLVKEFDDAGKGLRGREDVGLWYKRRYGIAQQFLELAEKNAKDPIALDALTKAVWQVNNMLYPMAVVGKESARVKAFALLQRDHVQSDQLGLLCERISSGFAKEYEIFLRSVLKVNSHKEVQALACLSLARFLNNRLYRLDLIRDRPELAKEFEELFDKEYLEELLRQDRAKVVKEIEALYEQAADKYGDVKQSDGTTVGEKAKSALFEIRHLSVGKEAPDIVGEDQDGKLFKLSDYRRKVVLLDFWSEL
jgi:hypothetical protein